MILDKNVSVYFWARVKCKGKLYSTELVKISKKVCYANIKQSITWKFKHGPIIHVLSKFQVPGSNPFETGNWTYFLQGPNLGGEILL